MSLSLLYFTRCNTNSVKKWNYNVKSLYYGALNCRGEAPCYLNQGKLKVYCNLIRMFQTCWVPLSWPHSPSFSQSTSPTTSYRYTHNTHTTRSIQVTDPCTLIRIQMLNSWTQSFMKVSGHNLESSQTWSFAAYTMFTLQTSFKHFCRGGGGGGRKMV